MTDRRDELIQLTNDFVDAFNRMNLDDVVSFFADDGIYEDSTGGRHIGHDVIELPLNPWWEAHEAASASTVRMCLWRPTRGRRLPAGDSTWIKTARSLSFVE